MPRVGLLVAGLLCAGLLAPVPLTGGPGGGVVGASAEPGQGALAWGPCEDAAAPFECAPLTVPLDHDDPSAESVDLALIRYPADPAVRDGAILLNPGGPGGSGYDFARRTAAAIDGQMELDGRFDIVGFDPRGTARSGRLDCLGDADHDFINYGIDPGQDSILWEVSSIGEVCRMLFGDVIHHYSTENTARDMDAIRAALGDEQISYIGVSYGTYLGAVYATLFPERVRAMVLDSAVGYLHDGSSQDHTYRPAAFEHAFDNWATWCATDSGCALHAADVGARWDALMDQLAASPLTTGDGRSIDDEAAYHVTHDALYNRGDWALLATALARAEGGDPGLLMAWYDAYNGRRPDGTYASSWEPNPAIRCASGIVAPTPSDPSGVLDAAREAAPRFTRFHTASSFSNSCRDWTSEPVAPIELHYDGDAPIVVVGGHHDPATPYYLAPELAAVLGSRARVVGYSGEGHGFILHSTCVTLAEAAVIRDLTLPAPYTTCAPDPDFAPPPYWDTLPVPAGVGELLSDPALDGALGYRPGHHYVETRHAGADPHAVASSYVAELAAQGFVHTETDDFGDGSFQLYFAAPDGSELMVELHGEAWMHASPWGNVVGQIVDGPATLASVVALAPTLTR